MHELSVALNILDIVESECVKAGASKVNDVELEIGKFSGIEVDALEFALETSTETSRMKSTKFTLLIIEGRGKCKECGHEFTMKTLYDECPSCHGFRVTIRSGQELKVKSINVD